MIDNVFRPEHSDEEVGDVYEKRGSGGVFLLLEERKLADGTQLKLTPTEAAHAAHLGWMYGQAQ